MFVKLLVTSSCTPCKSYPGDLLQLLPARHNCPVCRTALGAGQLSNFPRNYALEAFLDALHTRQMGDANGFELRASDLQLSAETLGTGGLGIVKAGFLQLGSVTMQVAVGLADSCLACTSCSKVTARDWQLHCVEATSGSIFPGQCVSPLACAGGC